jgi:hypothetical protein
LNLIYNLISVKVLERVWRFAAEDSLVGVVPWALVGSLRRGYLEKGKSILVKLSGLGLCGPYAAVVR